jgi:cytochrome c oxidase cbb3-type subunit 1
MAVLWNPIQASAQGVVAAWYFAGFNNLWLGAIAIGAIFYLIPKVVDRPIFSETLGQLSFWTFLLFAAWTGMARYIGGPFPAWLVSAGVVASVLALIPTFSIALNIHMTMKGQYAIAGWCPTARFLTIALFSLVFAAVFAAINALPEVSAVTNFSQANKTQQILGFYGFFSMAAFGAIYYILPRTCNWEWPCASLIHWHFWLAFAGIILGAVSTFLGGFLQGFALFDIANTFRSSVEFVTPFLFLNVISALLILASNIAFASQFVLMLFKPGKPKTGPTLLAEPIETSHEPAAV